MDLFHNAKSVRLKSHHDKFLVAEEDEESVSQDRNGSSRNARWRVEFVGDHTIRLKSCYGKYLTASTHPFLLGVTGKRVLQTVPRRLDSTVEWEPLKAGSQVRLRTKEGNYLRANGGLPPWRNSVTHDLPHRTATQDWVLWDVAIVEIADHTVGGIPGRVQNSVQVGGSEVKHKPFREEGPSRVEAGHSESIGSGSESDLGSVSGRPDRINRQESSDSGTHSPPKPDGRLIHYHVADEQSDVIDPFDRGSFTFKGHNIEDLRQKLEEQTGLQGIYVCTRSPLNGKLYPIRLQLPPNNATMHIVVVPSTSRLAEEFAKTGI